MTSMISGTQTYCTW